MPLGNVADILSGGERILILNCRVEFPVVCSLEQIEAHLLRGEAGAALVIYKLWGMEHHPHSPHRAYQNAVSSEERPTDAVKQQHP